MAFEPLGSPAWEILSVPSNTIRTAGTLPAVSTVSGLLEFAGDADSKIMGVVVLPYRWKEGSTVHARARILSPTASTDKVSVWKLETDVADVSGAFSAAYGTYGGTATGTALNPNNAKKTVLVDLGEITLTTNNGGCAVAYELTRAATSSTLDTDTTAVVLVALEFMYQASSHGKLTELGNGDPE